MKSRFEVYFQCRVLRWYRRNRRDLPWRSARDPYRIWVSEVMLQQTQVKTVVPYYERFIARFPDVQALARASESAVLALWSGLGYYSRARSLHRAARQICRLGGTFPTEFSEILKLPGVGRYTAGAIASIAFEAPCPVVDGNVRRLFSRYFGRAFTEAELWSLAGSLLPKRRSGDYNQALMEIGSTVCQPERPLCRRCPLRKDCCTRGDEIPGRKTAARSLPRTMVLLALTRNGKFWLEPRGPAEELLRNLWCFPVEYGDAAPDELQRRLLGRFGLSRAETAGCFRHSIMRYRFQTWVLAASCPGPVRGHGAWIGAGDLSARPHSSIVEKALAVLRNDE